MIKLHDAREVGVGLVNKSVGLILEAAGALAGNDRLRDAGRQRQEAGTERLMGVEEESKAAAREAEAEARERRQGAYQPAGDRSNGRGVGDKSSAGYAAAEGVKGTAKQALGAVTGDDDLREEGEAQRGKARSAGEAAKHEAKAETHRRKAETKERAARKTQERA